MKTIWFEGLKQEEAQSFKQEVLSSKNVLDKLNKIVYNMLKEKQSVSFSDYDSPSWSAKQAHTNGFCEAMREILKIIQLDGPSSSKP